MFAVRLARTNRAMVRAYVRTVSAYAERIIRLRAIPDCASIRCHYLGVSPKQENSTMIRYMILFCVAMVGCEQKTVVIANDRVAEAGAPFATLSPNEQCANSDECDSGECVPIYGNALPDGGSCWSDSFVGCERVNFEDWVIAAFCDKRILAVCQLAPTAETETLCEEPNGPLDPWIAHFKCCNPSIF